MMFADPRLPARIWAKTNPNGPWSLSHGVPGRCWIWTGSRSPRGYGKSYWYRQYVMAHRLTYESLIAPIPDGLNLDHLCCNPSCVNPAHLEPVTQAENIRRWVVSVAYCSRGHRYDDENTARRASENYYRRCRACEKRVNQAWVAANHPPERHGTAGYSRGCRCQVCGAARRQYDQARQARLEKAA